MNSTDQLNVWYENTLVGQLWRNETEKIGFEYDDHWIETGFAISCQLPLAVKTFPPEENLAHFFFENLLPEEGARRHIVRDLKLTDTAFNLLFALGRDCAGALSILAPGLFPDNASNYQPLNEKELHNIIKQKGGNITSLFQKKLPRLSLAGAQDKLAICYADEKYYLPKGTAASSHLLKFELANQKNVPVFECFLSELAQSINLPVVNTELKKIGKTNFLLIARYDRALLDQHLKRIHQEDFCQALGISYTKKYQAHGGPSFVDCYQHLLKVSALPIQDSEYLLKWHIFNALAGNSDAHAKNISLIYKEEGIRLAPFYDLVCTRAIEGIAQNLAFSIGDEYNPSTLNARHWKTLAKDCKVKEEYLLYLVRNLAEQLLQNMAAVLKHFESKYGEYPALQRVILTVNKQCKKILNHL